MKPASKGAVDGGFDAGEAGASTLVDESDEIPVPLSTRRIAISSGQVETSAYFGPSPLPAAAVPLEDAEVPSFRVDVVAVDPRRVPTLPRSASALDDAHPRFSPTPPPTDEDLLAPPVSAPMTSLVPASTSMRSLGGRTARIAVVAEEPEPSEAPPRVERSSSVPPRRSPLRTQKLLAEPRGGPRNPAMHMAALTDDDAPRRARVLWIALIAFALALLVTLVATRSFGAPRPCRSLPSDLR
jgi:hypothetical protein